jgi:hypothetical protein
VAVGLAHSGAFAAALARRFGGGTLNTFRSTNCTGARAIVFSPEPFRDVSAYRRPLAIGDM